MEILHFRGFLQNRNYILPYILATEIIKPEIAITKPITIILLALLVGLSGQHLLLNPILGLKITINTSTMKT